MKNISLLFYSKKDVLVKISIKKMSNSYPLLGSYSLPILLLLLSLLFNACNQDNNRIVGHGDYISQDYTISNIDELLVSSYAKIYITKGNSALRIEGQSNILAVLHVDTANGKLEIGKNNNFGSMLPLKIYLSVPQLSAIQTSGDIKVSSDDQFTSSTFKMVMSGIAHINLALETEELTTTVSGDAEITLEGTATRHDLNISGECELKSYLLFTDHTLITASGFSTLEVQVAEKLDVIISGSTTVYYRGNPIINQEISGEGRIISTN